MVQEQEASIGFIEAALVEYLNSLDSKPASQASLRANLEHHVLIIKNALKDVDVNTEALDLQTKLDAANQTVEGLTRQLNHLATLTPPNDGIGN